MKLSKLAYFTTLCLGMAATALGQAPLMLEQSPAMNGPIGMGVAQVGYCDCGYAGCGCEAATPSCGCEGACDGGCDAFGSCDDSCTGGIFDGHGCPGGCGILGGLGWGDCNCGVPYPVLGHCGPYKTGGWVQLGYHDQNLALFNSRKNDIQTQQAWIYAEKEIDTSCGAGGVGGRIDYLYGTDAQDTQAFGIDNGHWDNSWDNGPDYGHAIPQAYMEVGYGDWRVKTGHFFTIIGYEVVAAVDNFLYSHAYTMYNSEPFTHTGTLLTYSMTEDIELYNGYVLGWDSGFEDNGDAYLGGASVTLSEDITLIYTSTIGRFGDNAGANERGTMQSFVMNLQLTDELTYIFQNDWLDTEDATGLTVRDTVGINQYLIHEFNDCWSYGARFEWWHFEGDSRGYYGDNAVPNFVAPNDYDIFELTLGTSFRPHANLMIRPEIRWDWVDGNLANLNNIDFEILENNERRQTTFGIDTIFLF